MKEGLMDLRNKVVVVTGAASGIGLAMARRFAAEGATVIASDLPSEADRAISELGTAATRFVAANVGIEDDIRVLAHDVLATEGRIDLFCSNAGIGRPMDGLASQRDWDDLININFMSQVWAARHVLPHMLTRGEGYLLNVASAAGLLTELGSVGYASTKHASVGFSEWLAFTYRNRGVRVSVLCPEGVRTRLLDTAPYLWDNAITSDKLAGTVVQALGEERFLITTHPTTLRLLERKVADYEGYITGMAAKVASLPL
jgi:NAD(P)-dependent dehydrogenase (short-subunit alcohol dehydrogenase family)